MNDNNPLNHLKSIWAKTSGQAREDLVEDELFKGDMDRFYLILGGHIFFETLSAAVRFDLFSLLSQEGGLTGSQIAQRLGIEEKPARILLLGLASLKLLLRKDSAYFNSPLAELLLTRQSPKNCLSIVEWQHHINYKAMHSFYDALKANKNVGLQEFKGTEPTLYQRLVHYPELEKVFQDAMQQISVQANTSFAQFVDLSHVKHLVDVGGGNATNIIGLARKYPTLRATVFDSSSVCGIARANIERVNLGDRLGAVAGNCFTDPFPQGADCLLFCHFFTIWTEDKDRLLLKKCYDALPPGGSAIIFNMMQLDSQDGPLLAAMGSPYFLTLATGEGMLYSWSEYEAWMKEAGFKNITRQELPKDHGVITGRKP